MLQCFKFYTDQQSDLKRVEQLNNLFFRLMALGADAPGTLYPEAKIGAKALAGNASSPPAITSAEGLLDLAALSLSRIDNSCTA